MVQNNGFVERYHRYYFKDIQGFTIQPSKRRRSVTLALSFPLLIALFVITLAHYKFADVGWEILMVILGLPCLCALAVNWFKGPTCTTRLYTAVSDVEVLPLRRERAAIKAIRLISEFVKETQGPIDPTQLGFFAGAVAQLKIERKTTEPVTGTARNEVHAPPELARQPAATPWLLALGGMELLQAFSAIFLIVFGAGQVRQVAFFSTVMFVLLTSTVVLARGNAVARLPGLGALSHAVIVGLASYVSFFIDTFRNAIRNPTAADNFSSLERLDPSSFTVKIVLWFSIVGAWVFVAWSFGTYANARKST